MATTNRICLRMWCDLSSFTCIGRSMAMKWFQTTRPRSLSWPFFRPFGARSFLAGGPPRLTPWALFFRRFAAGSGLRLLFFSKTQLRHKVLRIDQDLVHHAQILVQQDV